MFLPEYDTTITEEINTLILDALQENADHDRSERFYAILDETIDRYLTERVRVDDQIGFDMVVKNSFKMFMDVMYRLDTSQLTLWDRLHAEGAKMVWQEVTHRDHRRPPKPKHFYIAPKGNCRFCGQPIIEGGKVNRRRTWHPECLKTYKTIYWLPETRKAAWKRDQGSCRGCGVELDPQDWHLDHRRRLVESNGDIVFWTLPNVQCLCRDCHKEKTAEENSKQTQKA